MAANICLGFAAVDVVVAVSAAAVVVVKAKFYTAMAPGCDRSRTFKCNCQ